MSQKDLYRRVTEEHYPTYVFLIGLSPQTARKKLTKNGKRLHLARIDGNNQCTTMEFDDDRINVVVEKGKIIGVNSIC